MSERNGGKRGPSLSLTGYEYRHLGIVGGTDLMGRRAKPGTLAKNVNVSSSGIDDKIVSEEERAQREEAFMPAMLDFMSRLDPAARLYVGVTYLLGGELPGDLRNLQTDLGINREDMVFIYKLGREVFQRHMDPQETSEHHVVWTADAQ